LEETRASGEHTSIKKGVAHAGDRDVAFGMILAAPHQVGVNHRSSDWAAHDVSRIGAD
jgi:hypothetical protein